MLNSNENKAQLSQFLHKLSEIYEPEFSLELGSKEDLLLWPQGAKTNLP